MVVKFRGAFVSRCCPLLFVRVQLIVHLVA